MIHRAFLHFGAGKTPALRSWATIPPRKLIISITEILVYCIVHDSVTRHCAGRIGSSRLGLRGRRSEQSPGMRWRARTAVKAEAKNCT